MVPRRHSAAEGKQSAHVLDSSDEEFDDIDDSDEDPDTSLSSGRRTLSSSGRRLNDDILSAGGGPCIVLACIVLTFVITTVAMLGVITVHKWS